MKKETLFEVLGDVSEKYVKEARVKAAGSDRHVWMKWDTLAACAVLAVCAGGWLIARNMSGRENALIDPLQNHSGNVVQSFPSENPLDLPMLTIAEDTFGGMGFEGYMAYDVSELVNANPWSETAKLSTMPVYKNALTFYEGEFEPRADLEVMQAFLLDVAARLGMDTDNLQITAKTPVRKEQEAYLEKTGEEMPVEYLKPTKVTAEEDGIEIEVGADMTATVTFEPAVPLPEKYTFTYCASSYEDMLAAAEYFQDIYLDVLKMEHPGIDIYGGDYNIYGEQGYHIGFFDKSGDITNQILNYHFNRVVFYCDSNGELRMIRIFSTDLSDKTGDYPIISVEGATDLLMNGHYITSVPYEMPGEEYIAKVELVYRTGIYEEYYMPYYRFYVELPDEKREGELKTYGAYYVPAVEEIYLSNMPVWDGRFN